MSPQPPAGSPAQPQTPAAPQAGAGDGGADLAALKAELETLKGRVTDSERNAQFWYEKAQSHKPAEPKPAATADADDNVDVLDVITTKGKKGLDELVDKHIQKKGYVSREEAEGMVNAKANQLVTERKLLEDYPDLGDKNSEFFKQTALVYGELKQKGLPEHMAMEMAVERTELSFLRAGKHKTPQQKTDDAKAQREADRLARIKAQGGERGNRQAEGSEEDEDLTPEQERIAVRMLMGEPGADGKPMDRDAAVAAYKARAKKGVAIRGGLR